MPAFIFLLLLTGVVVESKTLYTEPSSRFQSQLSSHSVNVVYNSTETESACEETNDINLKSRRADKTATFHLYTKNNTDDGGILGIGNVDSLKDFDVNNPTKVIIHGWTHSAREPWVKKLRRGYLKKGNYNVIAVDWIDARNWNYFISVNATREVGAYLAAFLKFLEIEKQLSLDDVHLLGHSLGAHVAGFAGSHLKGRIGRITALDAAAPSFELGSLNDPKNILDITDAKFVDAIHTNAGFAGLVGFGVSSPIGHVDFYPNGGGLQQPGCNIFSLYCSHERAFEFMMESVEYPENFPAVKCDSYDDFKNKKCKNDTAYMGEYLNLKARGKFYLQTNSYSPFGKRTAW